MRNSRNKLKEVCETLKKASDLYNNARTMGVSRGVCTCCDATPCVQRRENMQKSGTKHIGFANQAAHGVRTTSNCCATHATQAPNHPLGPPDESCLKKARAACSLHFSALPASVTPPEFRCSLKKKETITYICTGTTHQSLSLARASEDELVHGPPVPVAHLLVHQQRAHVEEVQRVPRLEHPAGHPQRTVVLEAKNGHEKDEDEEEGLVAKNTVHTGTFCASAPRRGTLPVDMKPGR